MITLFIGNIKHFRKVLYTLAILVIVLNLITLDMIPNWHLARKSMELTRKKSDHSGQPTSTNKIIYKN